MCCCSDAEVRVALGEALPKAGYSLNCCRLPFHSPAPRLPPPNWKDPHLPHHHFYLRTSFSYLFLKLCSVLFQTGMWKLRGCKSQMKVLMAWLIWIVFYRLSIHHKYHKSNFHICRIIRLLFFLYADTKKPVSNVRLSCNTTFDFSVSSAWFAVITLSCL